MANESISGSPTNNKAQLTSLVQVSAARLAVQGRVTPKERPWLAGSVLRATKANSTWR